MHLIDSSKKKKKKLIIKLCKLFRQNKLKIKFIIRNLLFKEEN